MRGTELDTCFAAALRGEPADWPAVSDAVDRVAFHGIAPVLVSTGIDLSGWPPAVVAAIREEARIQAVWEATQRGAVCSVIEDFARLRIPALVLKGTALAYSVYDKPFERRRGDCDLLVRRAAMDSARETLAWLGWTTTERQAFQETWTCVVGGFEHQVDLHWRLRDMVDEPAALEVDRLFARSHPLPGLHPAARTTDPATTLVNCALNHAAHRTYGYGDGRAGGAVHLGGLLDTDRLVRRWPDANWSAALDLAEAIRAARVLATAIGQASDWLGTAIPLFAVERLERMVVAEAGTPDPWSDPPAGPSIARLGAKVRAAAGWRAKRDVLIGRLMPSPAELGLPPGEVGNPGALRVARLARLRRIARRMLAGSGR